MWRNLLDGELDDYKAELPSYTLGQTMFSILTVATGGKFDKETLLSVSDEELYKACRISLKREITPLNDQI